jgi:hypothetical protein
VTFQSGGVGDKPRIKFDEFQFTCRREKDYFARPLTILNCKILGKNLELLILSLRCRCLSG